MPWAFVMRHRQLFVSLCLLVSCLPCTALAADWPGFLGPERNGTSGDTGLLRQFPAGGPTVVWRRAVGPGYSGPVVVGDRLILFHYRRGHSMVECMSTQTGSSLWTTEYRSEFDGGMFRELGPRATPTIADGLVYTMDADSTMQCLDLATGNLLWRRALAKDYAIPEGYFGNSSSPLIEGELILVNLGAPQGAGLAAFDRHSGKTVWTTTNEEASYSSPVAATIGGQRYSLFFARGGLHAVDPRTGGQYFFFPWRPRLRQSVSAATPLVVGNRVMISASYGTGAALLEVADGRYQKVWTLHDVIDNHYNTCVYHEGHLYGIDGRQEGGARLRCVEWNTGTPAWTEDPFGCASIILADGRLVILNEKGQLILAAASSARYQEAGRASILKGTCRAHPALAGGQFYARDNEQLVRVDLRR